MTFILAQDIQTRNYVWGNFKNGVQSKYNDDAIMLSAADLAGLCSDSYNRYNQGTIHKCPISGYVFN
tara:strand:+ start:1695 stop:1895 length:201 start_codon:yes stop_codon:yes gene_type:complete